MRGEVKKLSAVSLAGKIPPSSDPSPPRPLKLPASSQIRQEFQTRCGSWLGPRRVWISLTATLRGRPRYFNPLAELMSGRTSGLAIRSRDPIERSRAVHESAGSGGEEALGKKTGEKRRAALGYRAGSDLRTRSRRREEPCLSALSSSHSSLSSSPHLFPSHLHLVPSLTGTFFILVSPS